MNYETIINSNIEKFKKEYGFDFIDDNKIFEIYINQLFAKKYRFFDCMNEYERFDLTNVGGGDDSGIDGLFIRVNGSFVYNTSDIDNLVKNINGIDVEFIFIQSKNKISIDTGEMLKFFSGIKNFLSETQHDIVNSKIEDWIELKNYLYSEDILSLFHEQPKVSAIYAYKGTNINDEHVIAKISEFKKDIELMKCCCSTNAMIYDGADVFKLINEVKGNFSKTIPYYDSFELKDSENVISSIVLLCNANDLLLLLKDDEDGQLRKELFNDNVRDFQGDTIVNREILETIKTDPSKFCLYNNGITIVCKSCSSMNRRICLNNPQIVNGCQTCSTLYNADKIGIDLKEIDLIIKVISTNDLSVMNSIIKGTNRQNVVYDESFEITKQFHKTFEEYVKAIQSDVQADEKVYYERRSNQFNNYIGIDSKNVFGLRILIQSYVSIFLLSPYCAFEHEIELLKKFDGQIFKEEDNYITYYAAVLLSMKLDRLFKKYYDDYRYISKFKYQLMSLFCHLKCGRIPDLKNKNKVDDYCKRLISMIRNEDILKHALDESVEKFVLIKNKWIELKGQKYLHAIKNTSKFDIFMLEELGYKYNSIIENSTKEDTIYYGIVSGVHKDRNGLYYCFIKTDPVDVFVHEDDNPKTSFINLSGKKVKFKIISNSFYGNPRGKILNVYKNI